MFLLVDVTTLQNYLAKWHKGLIRCRSEPLPAEKYDEQRPEQTVHTQQAVSADPSLPAEHGRMISALANGLLSIADDIGTLLPSHFCCSNMACTSLATVSEGHALVRGRACVCAGCHAARYVRSLRHLQGRVAMALLSDHFKHCVGICLDLCPELSTVNSLRHAQRVVKEPRMTPMPTVLQPEFDFLSLRFATP